ARPHGGPAATFDTVTEHPGLGLEAKSGSATYRLGRASWALGEGRAASDHDGGTVLSRDGVSLAPFAFEDGLRPGARESVEELAAGGLSVEIVSGDRDAAVRELAERLEVPYVAGVLPGDKTTRIAALKAAGHKPLMVGDGLNDAPALAAAHASMAPATAA